MPLATAFLRVLRGVLLLVAVLLGAYIAAAAWNLASDYGRTLLAAENDARNLAAALDEHAANTFGETSRTVLSLAETLPFEGGRLSVPKARQALNARMKRTRYLAGLAVYGADGALIAGTSGAGAAPGIAAREDFAFHRESAMPQVFIVPPWPRGERYIRVTTRLPAPDGSFAGIVEAQVDPEYFNLFYTAINVGAGGRIFLIRQDGAPLVEVPSTGRGSGELTSSAPLRESLYKTVSGTVVDEGLGIVAYRRLAKLPLIAAVSLAREEVVAPWRERAMKQAISATAVLALVAILVWLVRRQLASLDAQDKALQRLVEQRTTELAQRNAQLQAAYAELQKVSITDPLTTLKNRRYIEHHLDADVALSLRRYKDWLDGDLDSTAGADLLFFVVDLDHFKRVNDAHGHAAGDRALVEFSRRLAGLFRDSDFVARWGGEEFLAVARGADRGDAEAIAAKIRATIVERPFPIGDGIELALTASIGVACYPFLRNHPDALSWRHVVDLADRALYVAKANGRDGWVSLSATDLTRVSDAIDLLRGSSSDFAAACVRVLASKPVSLARAAATASPAA